MAAGLSIKPEGFKVFQAAFEEVIRSRCDASVFERVVLTTADSRPTRLPKRSVRKSMNKSGDRVLKPRSLPTRFTCSHRRFSRARISK
mgnify:CR=1 FL=1